MAQPGWFAPAALLCGLLLSSHSIAAAPAATKASAFCTKLQSSMQPLVKIPLSLFSVDDSTTDDMHAAVSQYVDCQFSQRDNSMIDIGLHDDSDGLFDDVSKAGTRLLQVTMTRDATPFGRRPDRNGWTSCAAGLHAKYDL
jgi:hypothetical protein